MSTSRQWEGANALYGSNAMAEVTYWFRATDEHAKWLRETCGAITTAAAAVAWDGEEFRWSPWVEVHVGSVTCTGKNRFVYTKEAVTFRAWDPLTIARIRAALGGIRSLRALTMTPDRSTARPPVIPFALLYEGILLRFDWWGLVSERRLGAKTGLQVLCSCGEEEDEELTLSFGRRDAGVALRAFHARALRRHVLAGRAGIR